MTLPSGTRLGPYEVLSPLGAGGMGEVYRARDARLGREVAIKVLTERLVGDREHAARFEREARAVAAVSHPNILAIHDFGEQDGLFYAVTELLEGETLRQRIVRERLAWRRAVEIATAVAEGLAAAHGRGMVHRDIKPENIFVTSDGLVKILDFGLARPPVVTPEDQTATPTESVQTAAGSVLGTVGYMSPEQVSGELADARGDIFSLGCVLYEMLMGRRAFIGSSPGQTMAAILRDQPPEIAASGVQMPEGLDRIVTRCLEKTPSERFQSARDLAFALRGLDRAGAQSGPVGGVASGAARALAESAEASVAVLPFRNMSADPEAEYFSDGVTEEIISVLSQMANLRVAARTSCFAFKGKDTDVRHIGRELGVRTVLEGSVRQAGRRLRVTAQLIDVDTGYHLWSQRYDREMEDVFAVQDEIARAIADTFQPRPAGAPQRLFPNGRLKTSKPTTSTCGDDTSGSCADLRLGDRAIRRRCREGSGLTPRPIRPSPTRTASGASTAASPPGRRTRERARPRNGRRSSRPIARMSIFRSESSSSTTAGTPRGRSASCGWRSSAIPALMDAYFWLALLLGSVVEFEKALEAGRRAVALEPLFGKCAGRARLRLTRGRRGDLPRRVPEYEKAVALDPEAAYPLWSLGLAQQYAGLVRTRRLSHSSAPSRRLSGSTASRSRFSGARLQPPAGNTKPASSLRN